MIKLSSEVQLTAAQFATQGNAVLGLRGSGKSYTATYLAEQLMGEKVPFTAFDPIGVWRNLKIPGKGPGFPVVVVGDDADLPLNQAAVPDIIRAAMREGVNLVIDLYSITLSKAAWRDIVEQSVSIMLHENKAHGLRHIFMEEAAEFAPQQIRPDQAKVYSVIEKLARMGGNASLGYTLINQRAEAVNKEVLENCDMVFLHKQRGRNSITNLGKWLKFMAPTEADNVMEQLPHLKAGECFILSADSDIPRFVKMPTKSSFHPDRQNPTAPKATAKTVDVSGWIQRLSDSIKKHEKKPEPKPAKVTPAAALIQPREIIKTVEVEKRVEVPVFSEQDQQQILTLIKSVGDVREALKPISDSLASILGKIQQVQLHKAQPVRPTAQRPIHTPKQAVRIQRTVGSGDGETKIETGLRKMMIALAQRNGMSAAQVGVRAGMSSTSGTFGTYLGKGRSMGWIEGEREHLTITQAGVDALGEFEALPTGAELLNYWLRDLEGGAARMLEALASSYPDTLTAEQVGEAAGISHSSGTFGTYLGKLRTLELVSGKREALKASDEFFE